MAILRPPVRREAPEYLVSSDHIIPVANISHILRPDDTVHIYLRNGQELRWKCDDEMWAKMQSVFIVGLKPNEAVSPGKE